MWDGKHVSALAQLFLLVAQAPFDVEAYKHDLSAQTPLEFDLTPEVGVDSLAAVSLIQVGPPEVIESRTPGQMTLRHVAGQAPSVQSLLQVEAALAGLRPPSLRQLAVIIGLVTLFLAILCWPPSVLQKPREETQRDLLPPVTKDPPKEPTPPSVKEPTAAVSSASSSSGGAGACCCGGGISSWFRRPAAKAEAREASTKKGEAKAAVESSTSPAPSNEVKTPAAGALAGSESPDFTGTWKCVRADGAMDAVFTDLGLGYVERCALSAFGWGAGMVTRIYEHSGNHVKITEKAAETDVQEWDIGAGEQLVQKKVPHLQTTYWDEEEPHVLIIEGKDVQKQNPKVWTTTRQYLVDKDNMVLETKTSSGHIGSWCYQRTPP